MNKFGAHSLVYLEREILMPVLLPSDDAAGMKVYDLSLSVLWLKALSPQEDFYARNCPHEEFSKGYHPFLS